MMAADNVPPISSGGARCPDALAKRIRPRSRILLAAVLLLAMASLSSAIPIAACANNLSDVVQHEAGIYIGVAITLTMLIVAVAYMIGTVTNNPGLLVFYKDELYHLFFSIVLLIGFSSIFYISCVSFSTFMDSAFTNANVSSACYSGTESPVSVAQCYFNTLETSGRSLVTLDLRNSINNEMDSTLVISFTNPVTGGVYLPFTAYKKTYGMQFEMLANTFAMPALVSISMQKILIGFSSDLVKWLLPIAFLLRILIPTRQMGNMLIGLSLALYIIIPVFYALNGAMDDIVSKQCPNYSLLVSDQVMGNCSSPTSFWLVARMLPQAFFLPNLTLAMVVTFMSGISKALRVLG
jgi:hypothetical protein